MKVELRKNKNGTQYYSFVYYDEITKKPKRITKTEIRKRFGKDIIDHDQAIELAKILDAELDSIKKRIAKRTSWESEFYDFNKLLVNYKIQQKKKAPNSYKNNLHYLKYYVLPFFLTIKKCNNLSMWYDFYPDFKDWLEEDARLIKKTEQKISYGSKNHAIKALNTFMKSLYKNGVLERYFVCEAFPSHKLTEKGIDDVISTDEMEQIYAQLIRSGHRREAVFFRFLYFTGLRLNEALGVTPQNLYTGNIEDQLMSKNLSQENITYYGYIVINSQPSHKTRGIRNEKGVIHYKPLKGRHKIDDKSGRTVVIIDKILWNELVRLHNIRAVEFEQSSRGSEPNQYPLFEGIDKATSTKKLHRAFDQLGLRYRSWHCCRHTRATLLFGETGNTVLAQLWLGHSSTKVLNRYIHIYEGIVRSAKKQAGDRSKIKKLEPVE